MVFPVDDTLYLIGGLDEESRTPHEFDLPRSHLYWILCCRGTVPPNYEDGDSWDQRKMAPGKPCLVYLVKV